MSKWPWRKTIGILGAGALLLTACGGAATTAKKAANSTQATSTPTKTALTGEPGGTVVDGLFEEPNTLNPILGPGMTYAGMVEYTMFRNLLEVKPDGSLAPDLATTVPTLANGGISKNGLVYTFTIRKDANWSDGKPVTAEDVITTWKLIMNPRVTVKSQIGWNDIASIKALSPKKLQITVKHPSGAFLANAFGSMPAILPSSVFQNMHPGQVNKAAFGHAPTVADGPFMFKSWAPGASITVVANPQWYGPKPKAKSIVFKIIPNDNTLLANAQAHEINAYYFGPIEQVKQLEAIKGADVHFTTVPEWESGSVNLRDPLLKNVKVRRALEMAINRQALIEKVWKGHGTAVAGPATPAQWDYNPALKPYPYDPKKAESILTSLGWKKGSDGYLHKNGKEFSIIYSTTAGNPWREASERLDQYWLKQIGVKMVIKNYPANAYFGTVLPSRKGWDIGEFENNEGPDPAAELETAWGCNSPENFGSYCNPKLDALLKEQDSMVSQKKRQPILFQVVKILHDDLPNLWYYTPAEIDTSIDMLGYVPNPYSYNTWNAWQWEIAK